MKRTYVWTGGGWGWGEWAVGGTKRTKAAAAKVNAIREKVERGMLKVSYVGN